MQVIRKTTLKVLLFIFTVSILAFAFVTLNPFTAKAQVVFDEASFESEYCVGDEVTIPNVTAVKDGTEYAMEKALVFPNGAKKLCAKEVLAQAGKYTVVYSTVIDGIKYEKKYDFKVKEELFGLQRQSGTAIYDANKDLVELNVGGNNPFEFNSVVDLSDNTLSTPFLEMYTVSSQTGERDFEQIMVTLTDVDDENNYINIRINAAPDFKSYPYTYYTSYVAVSINGQEYKGQDGSKIHTGNAYGRPTVFSFSNNADGGKTPENDRIQLYYVASEKQIYVYGTAFKNYGGLVVDFDSDDFYKEKWEGFAVDKCKLSVYAGNMKTASANIFVTRVDGQDLSAGFVLDNVAPELKVEVPETIPSGIVGYDYNVFNYSARDDYGISSTSVNAYYDYYSNYPVALTIKDGKIQPKYQGYYTLVYRAVDSYGHVTEKLIDIQVDNTTSASPLVISVSEEFDNCLAGARVDLKDYAITANPKYGDYTVKVSASCGNLSAEIIDEQYFYANAVGTWTVKYEVIDNLGRTEIVEKTFTASANATPIFDRDGDKLPRYMLSGKTYAIPDVKARKYNENETEIITPQVKYLLNGVTKNVTDGKITPEFSDSGDNLLTLTYFVGSVEYTLTSRVVQILKDYAFSAEKLFYISQGSANKELTETGLIFTATSDATVDFVTPLLLNTFETEVTMINNGTLTIVVADEKNAEQSVELQIKQELGVPSLYINGVKNKSFTRNILNIRIDGDVLQVESEKFSIKKYANGEWFEGFGTQRMTVSFIIKNGSQVKIGKVSNQSISIYTDDLINPAYFMDGSFERTYHNGAEIVIPRTYAIDAVSGDCEVYVSVWGNEDYLTSTDGQLLNGVVLDREAKFVVDGYGYYVVTYSMTDDCDNLFELTCSIYVPDLVKPEISVIGKVPSEVKVGSKINVPKSSAQDNLSEDMVVTVFAIDPSLAYKVVKGNQIVFDKVGVWTVRFFTMDGEGNITYKDYKVNVKEG